MPASAAAGGKAAGTGQPWGSDVDDEAVEASAIPLKAPAASKAAALVADSSTTSSSSSRQLITTNADSLMRTFQLRKVMMQAGRAQQHQCSAGTVPD
jgi:hypothetical protein